MQIIEKSITEITPYEKNPRKNDEAVEYVANSIKEFGFKVPIVIDKNGVIVAGHTRYKAAQELGLEKLPCIIADDLTEEQVKAFRLADNKVGELAEWDFDLLGDELDDIFDIDMSEFGFEFDDEEESDESEEENIYTSKVDIPHYEPSGNKVTLGECCNEDKYSQLLREIKESKLTEDEKAFLCLAAARHLQFNYKKIADYYASNASEEMQRLMEKSALVIIDYNDTIKNGYAVLRKTIMGLLEDE